MDGEDELARRKRLAHVASHVLMHDRRAGSSGDTPFRSSVTAAPKRITQNYVSPPVAIADEDLQMSEMNRQRQKRLMKTTKLAVAAAAALMLALPSLAQDAQTKTDQASGDNAVTLELNKLEAAEKGCRAYVVVSNPSSTTYDAYKLDLVMFQSDGIIGRRFSLDLAPLKPAKRTVKLFELDNTSCDIIGSFLVNDVLECKAEAGPVTDCLARLKVSSLTKVGISK